MGISWSYRQSVEDEEEFPFNFLNRVPNNTSSRRGTSSVDRRNSSEELGRWNWRNILQMSTGEIGSVSGNNGNRTSADSDYDERDESIATILRSLIRSGQVRLITADSSCADEDDAANAVYDTDDQRKDDTMDDLTRLKTSDVKTIVELDSGQFAVWHAAAAARRNGLCRLRDREYGGLGRRSGPSSADYFTRGDKCYVTNNLLPNAMSKVDSYRSKAFCSQYTRDGRTLITACQDQRIRFYDVTTLSDCGCHRSRRTKEGSPTPGSSRPFHSVEAKDVGWSVLDVAVSPDGRHAVYSSWSDYIHQCNVYGDQESNQMAFHLHPGEYRFCIFSLRFSTDGNEILAGASDRCLYVYDRQGNARTLKIAAHEDDVNSVCFADDSSQIIYSGGDDGLCKVWDRRTLSEERPKPVGVLAGHSHGVTFVDSKCDARYLISNSKDQSIKLWDIRRFSTEEAMRATRIAVKGQGWDYRWQNAPKVMKYRKVEGDTSVMTYRGEHTVLHTLVRCFFSPAFTTGQRYVYTGSATGACVVYDLLTGALVKKLRGHHACVRDVSWHPYRNEICTASWDAVVARWTYDGRAESDYEYDSSCSSNESSDEEDPADGRAQASGQSVSGRLVRIYRRRQRATALRRSDRLREQQRRRMPPSLRFD